MAIKRQHSIKCTVQDILNGEYVVQEGWNPNFIKTSRGNISRANIIGATVNKTGNQSITIDDGTGQIQVRSFEKPIDNITVGDAVMVIGKPRQFNNQTFILPEIIKVVNDKQWLEVRKLELNPKHQTQTTPEKQESITTPNTADHIIQLIRELDNGTGADIDALIERAGTPQAEKTIKRLLEEGNIFTIRPGKIKVLE